MSVCDIQFNIDKPGNQWCVIHEKTEIDCLRIRLVYAEKQRDDISAMDNPLWKRLLAVANGDTSFGRMKVVEAIEARLAEAEVAWRDERARCNLIRRSIHEELDKVGAPKAGSPEALKRFPENISYLSYRKRMDLWAERYQQAFVKALDALEDQCVYMFCGSTGHQLCNGCSKAKNLRESVKE